MFYVITIALGRFLQAERILSVVSIFFIPVSPLLLSHILSASQGDMTKIGALEFILS